MARKSRKSDFEKAVEAFSHLAWYVCLGLAALAYVLFHMLSQIKAPPATNIEQLGNFTAITMFRTTGLFLQYLAPAVFLTAALVSWLSHRRRSRLLHEAGRRESKAPLLELSWRDFEQLVGAHFERMGFAVRFTPDGADGGVDLVARRGSESFLVQCKQWRATQVGVSVVRELFGVMSARGATGAYVVSIGPFTEDAKAFAAGRNITLVDAASLLHSKPAASAPIEPTAHHEPKCPRCGAPMVRRIARQGSKKGHTFFGCSAFPSCRATLPIQDAPL